MPAGEPNLAGPECCEGRAWLAADGCVSMLLQPQLNSLQVSTEVRLASLHLFMYHSVLCG